MSADHSTCGIRPANRQDARRIAEMSRDLIERGLGWSWQQQRVMNCMTDQNTTVIVACEAGRVVGFVIAKFRLDEAHIVLLAVDQTCRRRGIASSLVRWIEKTALVAGIGIVYLEARLSNAGARAFYEALGYKEFRTQPGRYKGLESGVCLGKDLWLQRQ